MIPEAHVSNPPDTDHVTLPLVVNPTVTLSDDPVRSLTQILILPEGDSDIPSDHSHPSLSKAKGLSPHALDTNPPHPAP